MDPRARRSPPSSPQVFPLAPGDNEDEIKSIPSHRIKISGHFLERPLEKGRMDELSVHKVSETLSETLRCSDRTEWNNGSHGAVD